LSEDDSLLIESDLVLDVAILRACVEAAGQAAVVAPFAPWMDGTAVLLDEHGQICRFLPKHAQAGRSMDAAFKTVNVYRLDADWSRGCLVPALRAQLAQRGAGDYYETVFERLTAVGRLRMRAVHVGAARWYEIDTPADLHAAEALFRADR
jgi:choline kinase